MTTKTERDRKRILRGKRAHEILSELGLSQAVDFHALPRSKVDALLEQATLAKYRPPKDAPGSKARMFHAKLLRDASRVLWLDSEGGRYV